MICKKSSADIYFCIGIAALVLLLAIMSFFLYFWLGIFELVVALCLLFLCFIQLKLNATYNYIELTETQVIGHTGILNKKTQYAPLSKIQNIAIESSVFGNLFNSQTIIIYTAGTGTAEFRYKGMKDSAAFVEAVQTRLE